MAKGDFGHFYNKEEIAQSYKDVYDPCYLEGIRFSVTMSIKASKLTLDAVNKQIKVAKQTKFYIELCRKRYIFCNDAQSDSPRPCPQGNFKTLKEACKVCSNNTRGCLITVCKIPEDHSGDGFQIESIHLPLSSSNTIYEQPLIELRKNIKITGLVRGITLSGDMKDKTILITGGTGSLGQALTRELLKTDVHSIRLFSRNEYLQWQMKKDFKDERLRWMIGDIRDETRLESCLNGVDYVIHTAALKHISSGDYNPEEVIDTNIIGSRNIVRVSAKQKVKKVLGISSDKAVSASNLYGSTKFVMERLFQNANNWSLPDTKFSLIRSGNFIESHGNVFELWDAESKTGVLTLTDPSMERYFINIEDVAKFTIKCLSLMEGGEVFIPKMFSQTMVKIANFKYPHCKLNVTGRQPGEKLFEHLFSEVENPIDRGEYWQL